ncbi:hypothetical protein CVT26_001703 [Gymnopilus dilepis]|uniref:FAS1 domain-containing protein n=1 Tax=Gymnopilus dilepis TaxID=231916 RepID=A0A409YX62_9AGAR|nr:hypothetical protein CVT26_001703 [Gymnopilus dilepis]
MHSKTILFPLALTVASASATTLLDLLQGQSQLSNLVTLLNAQPAVVSALTSATNITLLAPHNDALMTFLNSPAGTAAAATPGAVAALLEYHAINGVFKSTAFTSTPVFVSTLLTNTSFTNVTGGQVVEGVAQNGGVSIFSGLKAKSSVTTADLTFDGGVVHVIDTVLTIPPPISTTALANNLTTLASALNMTNLLQTVDTLPNITVFAPTNDAFAAISSTIQGLSSSQLESILEYHVVDGLGYSSRLSDMTVDTLEGSAVDVAVSGSKVVINDATVTVPDVIVANGVVHVIDNVLTIPSDGTPPSNSSKTIAPNGGASNGSSTTKPASGAVNLSFNVKQVCLAILATSVVSLVL